MSNILIISPYIPWPLRSGGNTGVYYMLEYICKYENVYFLTSFNKNNNYRDLEHLKIKLPNIIFLTYDYRNTKYNPVIGETRHQFRIFRGTLRTAFPTVAIFSLRNL